MSVSNATAGRHDYSCLPTCMSLIPPAPAIADRAGDVECVSQHSARPFLPVFFCASTTFAAFAACGAGVLCEWMAAAAGGNHGAAVGADGALFVWGSAALGQLGTGDTADRLAPSPGCPRPCGRSRLGTIARAS